MDTAPNLIFFSFFGILSTTRRLHTIRLLNVAQATNAQTHRQIDMATCRPRGV